MKIRNFTTSLFITLISIVSFSTQAQDNGFIYGKVTTIDGKEFTGAIRWGKEEVFWTDMFNASKDENENLKYLSKREKEDLDDRKYNNNNYGSSNRMVKWISNGWNNYSSDNDHTHEFNCQFGEIKSIEITRRSKVYLSMQNGDNFELNGSGYNDIGSDIKVLDSELGEIKMDWDRIDRIDFMKTPSNLESKYGEPLYGVVKTYNGTFEGYIQWDHDERVDTDKLDGDTYDGDVSIEFGKLKSIEKSGNRSEIVLNSGRDMTLRGSNDVDSGNRGVIVTNEEFGRVDIPWKEFKMVTFSKPKKSLAGYESFGTVNDIKGTLVTTDGKSFKGNITYDLDERRDFEILQGKDDEIEYQIPFRLIKSISPKNHSYSLVTLKNGKELLLGESQDVSDLNSGALIFENSKEPTYVLWEYVKSITFN